MDTVVTPYLKKLESIEKELPNIARQILTDNSSEIVLLVKGLTIRLLVYMLLMTNKLLEEGFLGKIRKLENPITWIGQVSYLKQ